MGRRQATTGKRTLALFEIILILTLTFTISLSLSSKDVQAVETVASKQVCCEKTKDNPAKFCEQVDASQCDPTAQQAPTSCEQTAFCKPGCCAGKDGYCYDNYPRGLCTSSGIDGRFNMNKDCNSVNECKVGCCLIGTQASFITKSRCIAETAKYSDLEVDFRENVDSEQACVDLARTGEQGCCVTEGNCKFGAKATCDVKTTVNGTGFYKDKYCSELPNLCSCTPTNPKIKIGNIQGNGDESKTTCADNSDNVFYVDSCGNLEGVVGGLGSGEDCSRNLECSSNICKDGKCNGGQAGKGQCDYSLGSLCGDLNKDGKFSCESVNCKGTGATAKDKLSVDMKDAKDGKVSANALNRDIKNGEAWCLWDYSDSKEAEDFYGKDPVGATHYRSLCINGQELVEPCADFRKEYCFSSDIEVTGVTPRPKNENDILSARCLKNDKWQTCVSECNTADPFSMGKKDYEKALENDKECCEDIAHKDCQWTGKCVPAIKPGFKFWEGEGTDVCGKGNLDCTATFVCAGWDRVFGGCKKESGRWTVGKSLFLVGLATIAGGIVSGGALVGFAGGLLASGIMGGINGDFDPTNTGWNLVAGGECFSKDYLQASNNLCRSLGDCGADYNWNGQLSLDGFTNTEAVDGQWKDTLEQTDVFGSIKKLHKDSTFSKQAENSLKESLNYIKDKNNKEIPGSLDKIKNAPSWEKGQEFFNFATKASDDKSFMHRFFNRGGWGNYWVGLSTVVGANIAITGIFAGTTSTALLANIPGAITNTIPGLTSLVGFGFEKGGKDIAANLAGKVSVEETTKAVVAEGAKAVDSNQLLVKLANENSGTSGTLDYGINANGEFINYVPGSETSTTSIIPKEDLLSVVGRDQGVEGGKKVLEKKVSEETARELAKKTGTPQAVQSTATLANFLSGVNAGMWVYTAYHLIDTLATGVKSVTVSTQCKPWQAPAVEKEDQCEQCNPDNKDNVDSEGKPLSVDAFKKCTEYRCKSLGASCELINKGTTKEMCVSLFRFDVNPPVITPYKDGTSKELQNRIDAVTRTGFNIKGEIPIYERFTVGLQTDKPSQCKMSFDNGKKFEDMPNEFYGSNMYDYYHVQTMFYPASKNKTESKTTLTSGGNYQLYVRCQDAQGNANQNDFIINFKISNAPDITVPTIYGTSIGEEAYITSGQDETKLSLFVNEPSECRFDFSSVQYNDMKGGSCTTIGIDSLGFYPCKFTGDPGAGPVIKGINSKAGEVKYVYFKCKDKAGNFNKEPFRMTLKGSDPLMIKTTDTEPKPIDGEIKTSQTIIPVNLVVVTDKGAKLNGEATCRYTDNKILKDNYEGMSLFLDTNGSRHKQVFDSLSTGDHTFYVGCSDLAGNMAFNQTSFKLISDVQPPVIVRAYKDSSVQPSVFKIEVNEDATCKDSDVSFDFEKEGNLMTKDGNVHTSASEPNNLYYVICQDVYKNAMGLAQIQFA